MTLKQKSEYNILNRIDYHLKQSDNLSSVDGLDDLIMALSPTFYFKDISNKTISMFNVSGVIAHDYLFLQTTEDEKRQNFQPISQIKDSPISWLSPEDQRAAKAKQKKIVEELDKYQANLFPGDADNTKSNEASEFVRKAISVAGDNLFDKTGNISARGIELYDEQGGTLSIHPVNPKDFTKGFDVYSHDGNERKLLNTKRPVRKFSTAYNTAKKAMVERGMDKKKKPQGSYGDAKGLNSEQQAKLLNQLKNKLDSYSKIEAFYGKAFLDGKEGRPKKLDKDGNPVEGTIPKSYKRKLTENEKKGIISEALRQSKFTGTPIWDVVHNNKPITNKTLLAIGNSIAVEQGKFDASLNWWSRMKAEFKDGHRTAMERKHGAMPEGRTYENSPQEYWEGRAQLATEYARANAEYDREISNANLITDLKENSEAIKAANDKMDVAKDRVKYGAEKIGATLENVANHVEHIKSGATNILPPATGWPTSYGGKRRVKSLQGNIEQVTGYKSYREGRPSPSDAPDFSSSPEHGAEIPEGQQFALPSGDVPSKVPPGERSTATVAGNDIPSRERRYKKPGENPPKGVVVYTGLDRHGKKAVFWDAREARRLKVEASTAPTVEPKTPEGEQLSFNMAGENEMAEPMDDYKQAADQEEARAKRSQAKSKIRTARANARMAKARADEAEAKAKRSEADSGVHIADILAKLDNRIAGLSVHKDPKISLVLSKLDSTIKSIDKVTTSKK